MILCTVSPEPWIQRIDSTRIYLYIHRMCRGNSGIGLYGLLLSLRLRIVYSIKNVVRKKISRHFVPFYENVCDAIIKI